MSQIRRNISGSAPTSFSTIQTPSGTSPVADSTSDVLTLAAGSGITIVGDSSTDTVTISSTALSNPMTTVGDIIVGGVAGAPDRLPANSNSSLLFLGSANGATPTYQPIPVQGNLSYYSIDTLTSPAEFIFEITSGSATVGATYTNNTQTFTVLKTIASATRIFMSGTGAPSASGTLTKASGTGDATLTFSSNHQIYIQSTTPQVAKTSHLHSGVINGQLIHAFISPVGFPNLTFIPAGEISYHLHAARTAGTKDCQIRSELWETTTTGAPVAKIADMGPTTIFTGAEAEYFISYQMPTNYVMASSASRIEILNFAVVGVSGSSPDITAWVGNGADTHLNVSAGSVDATTFVPYTGATSNISLGSTYKVIDAVNPTNAQDYATKNYVDTADGAVVTPALGGFGISQLSSTVSTTGTLNNYPVPTGYFYYTGAGDATLNGLVAQAAQTRILIANMSSSSTAKLTVVGDATGSTAANRIRLPNLITSLVLNRGESLALIYDTTSSKWLPDGGVVTLQTITDTAWLTAGNATPTSGTLKLGTTSAGTAELEGYINNVKFFAVGPSNGRKYYDGSGNLSIDAHNRWLTDTSGNCIAYWGSGFQGNDQYNYNSLKCDTRELISAGGTNVNVDWSLPSKKLKWVNDYPTLWAASNPYDDSLLIGNNGSLAKAVGDGSSPYLAWVLVPDGGGSFARGKINWDSYGAFSDDYGYKALIFQNSERSLNDNFGAVAVDFKNRQLMDSTGYYPAVDFNQYWLMNIGITNNGPLLNWSSYAGGSVTIHGNIGGVGYYLIGDFSNGKLFIPTTGVLTLDWNSRYLYDNMNVVSVDWDYHLLSYSGTTSVDWQNRVLKDSAGTATVLNWTTQATTAVSGASYTGVSGSNIQTNDTFDGYTVGQVVAALRAYGLLA